MTRSDNGILDRVPIVPPGRLADFPEQRLPTLKRVSPRQRFVPCAMLATIAVTVPIAAVFVAMLPTTVIPIVLARKVNRSRDNDVRRRVVGGRWKVFHRRPKINRGRNISGGGLVVRPRDHRAGNRAERAADDRPVAPTHRIADQRAGRTPDDRPEIGLIGTRGAAGD